MLRLEDRDWKAFMISDLFTIERGNYGKRPEFVKDGACPFHGASAANNGITGWSVNDDTMKLNDGNCIVVNNNGSVGRAYYCPYKALVSSDVSILRLKKYNGVGRNVALFLITAIERQSASFSYSRKWSIARMKQTRIMLPVTSTGEPDYQFMEDYVREMIGNKV